MINLLVQCVSVFGLYDLEDMAHECVIAVKQIQLSEYPYAFNPSIVRWKDLLLMSFRIIPDPKYSFNSELGLVCLNEQFEVIRKPQLLAIRDEYAHAPCRAEDGRLIVVGERLFLVYSDNEDIFVSRGGFRLYIGEIRFDGERFTIHNIQRMTSFPGNDIRKREKNWVPFVYDGQLLLSYSLSPHVVLKPQAGIDGAELFSQTADEISWDWGELRGGTPAVLEGDHYLSFFHSGKYMKTAHSKGQEMLHYFMGAYLFSAEPPFKITHISKEPLVGKEFYHGPLYKPYWHPVVVVFPGGLLSDDDFIGVVYGRQDHELWIVKLDKKKLYSSLIPVVE